MPNYLFCEFSAAFPWLIHPQNNIRQLRCPHTYSSLNCLDENKLITNPSVFLIKLSLPYNRGYSWTSLLPRISVPPGFLESARRTAISVETSQIQSTIRWWLSQVVLGDIAVAVVFSYLHNISFENTEWLNFSHIYGALQLKWDKTAGALQLLCRHLPILTSNDVATHNGYPWSSVFKPSVFRPEWGSHREYIHNRTG